MSDEDINRRLLLAHAMLLTLRGEVVLAFNTSTQQISTYLTVNVSSHHFAALHGQCPAEATAPGSYAVTLAPLDYLICESRE